MKKILIMFTMFVMVFALSGCNNESQMIKEALNHKTEAIKESQNKYIWYLKDYVGKNAKSFGEMKGDKRYEKYGNGNIYFTFVSTDGTLVTNDNLEQYIVVGQSLRPNTEIKYQYKKYSDGTEYDTSIESQNIEYIELKVAKLIKEEKIAENKKGESIENSGTKNEISEKAQAAMNHTPISVNSSPDKYTWYLKDYVGRNLTSCGTLRLGGFLMEDYGEGGIKFVIITDDGSAIDLENDDELKKYIVTGQSVAPNSEIKYTFDKDNNGKEYSWVDTQTLEQVELYVSKISN